ncbi:MAG: hypothetical protein M3H12_01255, partial [Chromatiales bacterium]
QLPDDEPQDVPTVDNTFPSDMVVAVNPLGGSGNNLDLKLTLNIKSLVKFLDAQEDLIKKEKATSDTVKSDTEIVLHDPKRCDEIPEVTWLVYVHTQPHRGDKRTVQRRTWANERLFKKRDIRVIFVMGSNGRPVLQREVAAEFSRHRDIVQGNFMDDEYSGPTKARLALKWIATYCAKAKYILKVEDDTFVDIFWLRDIVKKHWGSNRLIACPLWPEHSRLIRRDPRKCSGDIWCLRYTEFPGMTHFPRYCDAIGYLVSRAMARRMFEAVPKTAFFWLEEVYMTAMLPSRLDDVEYVNFFSNYTNRPVRAFKDTVKLNKRMYVFSKVPYAPQFNAIWEWTLAQLRPDEVDLLSAEVAAHIPRVDKKVKPTSVINIMKP